MNKLKFNTIKIPVSDKEKRKRANFYMADTGRPVDIEAFVKKEIFDEYIEMKCLACDYEETLPFDIFEEMLDQYRYGYPEDYCPKCNGDFVPRDVYNLKKNKSNN